MFTMPPVGENVAFNDSVKWVVDSHDPTVAPARERPRRGRHPIRSAKARWRIGRRR